MSRCMVLAGRLFDAHRSLPKITRNEDGSIDEALTITRRQVDAIMRDMTPAQRAFYDSPAPIRRIAVRRWSGSTSYLATTRAIREAMR